MAKKKKIVYDTHIKSLNLKPKSDGLNLEGKKFTSDEKDTLSKWMDDTEKLTITLTPIQENLPTM